MSRDGYLPPGIEQEDIDRYYEAGHDPDDDRPEPERPDEYDPLDIIDRERRDEEIAAELALEEADERKREPDARVETIAGIPFVSVNGLSDTAKCVLCGTVCDVGGEIREHIAWHEEERMEAFL